MTGPAFTPPRPSAPLVLTMGEPAGIGGELTLKLWLHARQRGGPAFAVLDDPERLGELARTLGLTVPIAALDDISLAAGAMARALPVLPLGPVTPPTPGTPDPANAALVIRSLATAVELALGGEARAVITNPIHKATLHGAGFPHPGHTEYLARATGAAQAVMLLVCPGLRVSPLTIHMALADVPGHINRADIVSAVTVLAHGLSSDFAISAPRIAVTALNPHGGEGGAFGAEERDIISPALEELRRAGIDAIGPFSADSLFHAEARAGYDAVLAMYHDQALIPLKTLNFLEGVNVTLGLPIIRTSPDHGTAFDIAGTGKANPASLIAAVETADLMARNRFGADKTDG